MTAADEASAEAVRRWPIYSHGVTDTRDIPVIERGRDCFVDGAEWQASRDAAAAARAEKDLARMNREWTKVAAINESLAAQLQAAQATIAEALSYFGDGETAYIAKVLRRVDTSAHDAAILAARVEELRATADAAGEAWVHGSWNLTMDTGQWLRDRAASIEQTEANRG